MQKQIMTLAAAATALAFLVTGCSGTTPDTKPKPSATTSAAPAQEETYNKCVDGRATVLASDVERGGTIEVGDCAEVSVVGAAEPGSSIRLGAVKLLVVEADGTDVRVGKVERIVIPGAKNTIAHAGDPKVEDQGSGNTVTKR